MDTTLFKEVMLLAFPVIVSNISRVFIHITDTAMVGHLGKNQLVAVGMSGMLIWIAISIGIGFRMATQSIAARRIGQNKFSECGLALRNAQLMCFIITLPLSFLGYYCGSFIVPFFLSDPNVIPICIDYFSIVSFSIYFSVSAFIFQGFYTGIERTRVLMYVTIISNLLNVYLNAGFIYGYENIHIFFDSHNMGWLSTLWGWYDFKELGVKGAAIATLLSSFIMMISYFLYLFKNEIKSKYDIFNFTIDFKLMKKQFSIGYPQSLSEVALNSAFVTFYKIMGIIGTTQLAATQVVFAVAHASFLPAVGVGQACATLVGKYLGKKNINKATQSMIEGLRGSLMIMGSMGLVFIFFPHIIVPLFTSDQEVISLGKQILPWVGLIQFVDAFAITLWFALSGAGDTKFTGYLGIVASWGVFVPLSYILGIKLNFGLSGPWIAFAVFLIIEASLVIFRVLQGKWKHIEV
mgnify:CR=1 FL=1